MISLMPNVVLQSMKYAQWMATRGLHVKAASSVLGGLAAEGGAAVVLNARSGVEVEELRKAGMKVVGMFSEGKEFFDGALTDSKTGKVWEGWEEEESEEEEDEEETDPNKEAAVQEDVARAIEKGLWGGTKRKTVLPGSEAETEKGSVYETEMAAAELSGAKNAEAEKAAAKKAEAERFAATALVTPPEGVAGEDVHPSPLGEQ
jgi:hypothetical protein